MIVVMAYTVLYVERLSILVGAVHFGLGDFYTATLEQTRDFHAFSTEYQIGMVVKVFCVALFATVWFTLIMVYVAILSLGITLTLRSIASASLTCVQTVSRSIWKPVEYMWVWFTTPPVQLVEMVTPDTLPVELDLRALPAQFMADCYQSWFEVKTKIDQVEYLIKYPARRGSEPAIRTNRIGCGFVEEQATSQGRTRATKNAIVPGCLVTFYDQTDKRVLGNGGRVTKPGNDSKNAQLLTSKHVIVFVRKQLVAGHDIILTKMGETSGPSVTLEKTKEQTLVLEDAVLAPGLDLASVNFPNGLASSMGVSSCAVSERATPYPEFWYQTNAVWTTSSEKVMGTKVPFHVVHSGSTEPGASGCFGFKRLKGQVTVSYLHWGADPSQTDTNYAINLVELYRHAHLPPKAESRLKPEGSDDYSDDEREPRTQVDDDFDVRD